MLKKFLLLSLILTVNVSYSMSAWGQANGKAKANTQKVINLGAPVRNIRIARFHSAWLFGGMGREDLRGNQGQLRRLFTAFNDDFRKLSPQLPPGVTAVPEPKPELVAADSNLSWDRVQLALRTLAQDVASGDVVFFYLMAHGKLDADGKPILLFAGNTEVPRGEIVNRLKTIQADKGARLVVLVTDNCSVSGAGNIERLPLPGASGIWRALYFGHDGFVDLSSTALDQKLSQAGFVIGGTSVFNEAFSRSLNLHAFPETKQLYEAGREDDAKKKFVEILDTNGDKVVSWHDEYEKHLQRQLDKVYSEALASLQRQEAGGPASPERQRMERQGGQQAKFSEYGTVRMPD